MKRRNGSERLMLAFAILMATGSAAAQDECDGEGAESTFQLIQEAVFDQSCTNQICHGALAAGGLDLRAESAYASLIDVDSVTADGFRRVVPGEKDRSLLWLNLAAKTLPDEFDAPRRAMPLDPVPAISEQELELIRLWIEGGAPETGTADGTENFDPCLPDPEPVEITPLPVPDPNEGFQIHMPRWFLEPQSESEVCFATYYDVTDQVPERFRGPDGTTVRYKRNPVRQDPISHHLIVNLYEGSTGPNHPAWGDWTCHGGARDGDSCDPMNLGECGDDGSECATDVVRGVACIGYGPADAAVGLMSAGLTGIQEAAGTIEYAPGVFNEMPLKGIIMWNSHAFNLTNERGKLEAWLNFEFAAPEEQEAPATQIFNAEELFKMYAEPFTTDEPCHIQTMPPRAQLFELSSHMHQRGKRWRTFMGGFRCEAGPAEGEPCSPLGYDFESEDPCGGSRCVSKIRVRSGDCDLNGAVTVDEVISAVNIGLGTANVATCYDADRDDDERVVVDEIINALNAALQGVPAPAEREPADSLMYVSFQYNDPVILEVDPPLVFGGPGTPPDERAMTFCALYDNGYTDPNEVKRQSTSPPTPVNFPGIGGPCDEPTHCTNGLVGQACSGRTQRSRDASCDTAPGAGDGMCDACPLTGGVTTEDEMMLLLGQYFVRPNN